MLNRIHSSAPCAIVPTEVNSAPAGAPPTNALARTNSLTDQAVNTRLEHYAFDALPGLRDAIKVIFDDLASLPICRVHRQRAAPLGLPVAEAASQPTLRLALGAEMAQHHNALASQTPLHRTYARAHAMTTLCEQAVLNHGLIEAGSLEHAYLFLNGVIKTAPQLKSNFSMLVIWAHSVDGQRLAKHGAVLLDTAPRGSSDREPGGIGPNRAIYLPIKTFIEKMHFSAPQFVIIDPWSPAKITTFEPANSLDAARDAVIDWVAHTPADRADAMLEVSFAQAL